MSSGVSHGRGGTGNIGPDSTEYVDGEIVRTGDPTTAGGAYSAGRGGAGNIGSPRLDPVRPSMDEDVVPGAARVPAHEGRKSEEHIKKTDEDVPSNEATEKMAKGAVQGFKTPVEDHSKSPEWKAEKDREGDETLVGKRIKLWWPVDRRFRYGNINNFDPANNTHKITYDDGEVELLQLVNERWELISGSQKDDLRCPPKGWKQKQGKLVAEAMTPEIGDITVEPLVEPGKIVEEVHEVGSPSPRKEQYPLKQASGSEHSKKDKKKSKKEVFYERKGIKVPA